MLLKQRWQGGSVPLRRHAVDRPDGGRVSVDYADDDVTRDVASEPIHFSCTQKSTPGYRDRFRCPMPAFSMVVLDMDEKVSANVKEQSHF